MYNPEKDGKCHDKDLFCCYETLDALLAELQAELSAGYLERIRDYSLPEDEKKLLMGFVNNAVLSAYRQWVEDGKKRPLEDVIGLTNRLVLGGVTGFFG